MGVGELGDDVEICCETRSEVRSSGGVGAWLVGDPDPVHYTAVLLTSQWLIWARGGKSETVAASAQLKGLKAGVLTTPKNHEIEMDVTGFFGNTRRRIRGILAFGDEPAAQKLCEAVLAAVARLNPRRKPKIFQIFGIPFGR